MSREAPRPSAVACVVLLASLSGCAREPPALVEPASDPAEARRQLAALAAAGPVPIVVIDAGRRPSAAEVAGLAARGVTGLSVRFAPGHHPEDGRRLVVAPWGLVEPARICAEPGPPAAPEEERPLAAAWCEGARAVASVRVPAGTDRVERERAVWRATARLFPDDYAETYGLNLFGLRVTFGASFGF
ncbi:MAG: hypothetical protein NZ555_06345 [Geminicoccaceae bacterium]|nr:hypothetical protein [Geminicoccaceae bacterium]MCX8101870.1 hypothetical protein [Geminicoccaceae bacterium]MDW8371303.1 hypothetical protein [Geminicoccaceae bacterium]